MTKSYTSHHLTGQRSDIDGVFFVVALDDARVVRGAVPGLALPGSALLRVGPRPAARRRHALRRRQGRLQVHRVSRGGGRGEPRRGLPHPRIFVQVEVGCSREVRRAGDALTEMSAASETRAAEGF